MNGPQDTAPTADAPGATDLNALFAGDTGVLGEETRRVLVQLLLGSLDGQRMPKLWPTLLRDEALIRSRLSDLFLELVLDREAQVAFLRQVQSPDRAIPVLLRRKPLTFLETVLLLHLRGKLTQADAVGERAVVSRADLLAHLRLYEATERIDEGGFARRCDAAIEKVKKLGVLPKLRGGEERFEVSPTLKLLFSAEHIHALTAAYEAIRVRAEKGEAIGADDEPEDDDPADAEGDEERTNAE